MVHDSRRKILQGPLLFSRPSVFAFGLYFQISGQVHIRSVLHGVHPTSSESSPQVCRSNISPATFILATTLLCVYHRGGNHCCLSLRPIMQDFGIKVCPVRPDEISVF